ncbi:MAG TPA: sensor domain-containing diguanylate cyclase, partial [Vicinamibacteria bacterium]|nr:sensor domain-containing diguanylate cyclase [Vicinamibacteria bacterium]
SPASASPPPADDDRTLRALVDLTDLLSRLNDENEVLRAGMQMVGEALEPGGAAHWTTAPEGALQPSLERGGACPDREACRALAEEVMEDGEPRVRGLPAGGWVAAATMGPREKRVGVLTAHDGRLGSQPPAVAVLAGLAGQIGTHVERVRLARELAATSARLHVLHRLTATLTSEMDLAHAVAAFAAEIAPLVEFGRLGCGFLNESGDYLEIVGHPSGTCWGFGPVHPVVGSGPGAVLQTGEPLVEPDLLHHHRFIEDLRLLEEGVRSYVLLPLNARGRIIGVMALGSVQPDAFDLPAVDRLRPVADAGGLALDNVRLLHKTRELSITDEVTPLFNFRFFHQILERELKMVDRYQSCLSLIFLDLDRFKPINDQYGHLRGSRVLREVGFLLRAHVRETDYPVRYGGDEFTVILPQTDGPAATSLAHKLRRLIEGHSFLQEEGIGARVGVSFGVATYPTEANSKEALIRLADERMYAEKGVRGR